MTRLIVTHGRSQEFGIPRLLENDWAEALRWGLERVEAPYFAEIPISFAFYGDHWRGDADDLAPSGDDERSAGDHDRSSEDPPSDVQREIAEEIVASAPPQDVERLGWDTVADVVGALDGVLGVGRITLDYFVKDVDAYFDDETLRNKAIQRIIDAVNASGEDAILLAHSLGSVVAYDTLRRNPDLPVRGLITFGSPLGLDTVKRRLEETGGDLAFPSGVSRWANIYEPRDFVAANRALAGSYPSSDSRSVEDAESEGQRPGFLKLVAAHDALVYLSSVALGKATRSIVEDGGRGSGPEGSAIESTDGDRNWSFSVEHDSPAPPDDGERASGSSSSNSGARPPSRMIPAGNAVGRAASMRPMAPAASPPDEPMNVDDERGGDWQASASASMEPTPAMDNGDDERGSAAPPSADAVPGEPPPATTNGEPLRTVETGAGASFPPMVNPGSVTLLTFEVGKAASGDATAQLTAQVPRSVASLDLTVLVQAPNFEVVDEATGDAVDGTASISLDLNDPNALIQGSFHLRADDSGQRISSMIRLRFLHDNNPIGTITVPTIIAAAPAGEMVAAKPFTGTVQYVAGAPPGAELLLLINRDDDDTYQITATLTGGLGRSIPRARLGSFPVTGEAWEYARALLEKFRLTRERTGEARETRINSLGLDLWRKLPDEFHAFYWDHVHDKVTTILVCSEEPYIPWELIKPERSVGGETAPMLGQAFSMARWEDERQIPNPIVVEDFAVVAPTYAAKPLAAANLEADELKSRFGAQRVDPGNHAQVIELLTSKSLQVLHFSGHGEFEKTPSESTIALADIPLDIIDVNGARFTQNGEPPLVFLNACEVGNQGWSLTQIGGWAEAFCGAGSAAFVGPYWAVSDRIARKASMLFYGALESGLTVGEAMLKIRSRFHEDEEDQYHPTWLAYSLHCHPNVTVRFARDAAAQPPVA